MVNELAEVTEPCPQWVGAVVITNPSQQWVYPELGFHTVRTGVIPGDNVFVTDSLQL